MPIKFVIIMAVNLKLFENESFGVIRTAGTSEEPLFCLADICNAVDIANPSNVKNRLDEDDLHLMEVIDNMGRTQKAYFVSEAGMYDAILKSESKKARPFSRWITHEVLPSIRKTGEFTTPNTRKEPTISDKIKVATWLIKTLNLNDTSKLMLAKSIAEPLGLPTPDYTPSHGILKSASELLEARGLKGQISAQVFNKKAIEKGYLCEQERNSSHGQKKRFKSITNKGLSYGENQVNPNNPKSTQPLWYEDKFMELLGVLGFQLVGGLAYAN